MSSYLLPELDVRVLGGSLLDFLLLLLVFLVIVPFVVLARSQLAEHLERLTNKLLAHDLEDLVLLQSLSGDVQWEIVGVNDTADEVQVLGKEIFEVVLDEHLAYVQTDAGLAVGVVVVEAERLAGHEENGLELDLTLGLEVDPGAGISGVLRIVKTRRRGNKKERERKKRERERKKRERGNKRDRDRQIERERKRKREREEIRRVLFLSQQYS